MTLEYTVHNRDELVAAVRAAAQPSFAEAKENPVAIQCGSLRLTFGEGIEARRGRALVAEIRSKPKHIFTVHEQPQLPL